MNTSTELKKVVVTGGAGFIGSHVVHALKAKGIPVVVFDSLVSGSTKNVPNDVPLIVADIRDTKALAAAFEGASHIVHLAALISVPESMRDPESTFAVNAVGTQNVFDAARNAGVKRIVYASSAAVYGNDPALPKHESMKPDPQSPYAESKIRNEVAAKELTAAAGIPTTGLRFFNIYGTGQKGNHAYASVVPRWIDALKAGKEIYVYGDGEQTRDFIHVQDIAGAILKALESSREGAQVYNVASGIQVSLGELKDMLADISNMPIEWIQHPEREGDIRHSVADVSAIRNDLQFEASIPLAEGIKTVWL
ncbi:MAG: dTDP-glucose 4,6-dehydratase [Parcubacteria group bacterium]|nr:dTDP-glucose 4,6-dehydratase [Parcubacteria group bacterium]